MKEESLKNIAEEHGLDPDKFIRALNHAFSLKLIGRNYDPPIIIKEATTKKGKKEELTKLVTARIDEYIAIFSKGGRGKQGLRTGSLGTKAVAIKNLIKWMTENDSYSFNQILHAAEYYTSIEGKQDYRYLVASHRFIYNKGESKLSAIIDESLTENLQTEIFIAV